MWLLELLAQAVLFLAAISLVFIPLEYFWRADTAETGRIPWLRRGWLNDLLFYFGQILVFNSVTLLALGFLFQQIETSSFLPATIMQLPLPLKIVLVILLSDFLIYWGHRAQHRFGILWRFHRVHHTALHVDYIAAYREHPLDNIYTRGLETLPAVLLGLDLNTIAGFVTFRGLWALFIHSNVNIRLGFLEVLLGSPHLHHWHHDLSRRGLVNYANLSPLMDILFRTYYNPPERPHSYGIPEPVRQAWFWQMLDPLIPNASEDSATRSKK
ncbi:sterol desaturase family protein [Turneriella parva]|uniref:Fatty acid hydroxylase n=1 Tax=Turneriella parva (strain ATCC BAA-1111 / DSM 21527 / NCTC 11395 / H) TaxID=869212 RepID=I4B2N2_TURPD|nr:sterol desaturase family protein [Turneriella parva]AFM11539.1 fatty acid hydroxylase [Turneriella parva DSM 21527]